MKNFKLFEACENFEKLAEADLTKIVMSYRQAIIQDVSNGISAVNYLLTHDKKATQSKGITILDETFAKIGEVARNLTINSLEISIKSAESLIGAALFYTSPQNAGVGYDPITRTGGGASPAAYLDKINNQIKKLKSFIAK